MGSAASTNVAERKSSGFQITALRAPIFRKSVVQKVDAKANNKYCSSEITRKVYELAKSYGAEELTFEEFQKSCIYSYHHLLEQKICEAWKSIDSFDDCSREFKEITFFQQNELNTDKEGGKVCNR
mmetsp:Transcript_2389/g.6419  ORF Transcript_2389/g.6419 Transcript_2389/m.6419 type:complete len:126 (+) Transcript_2389:847-1224(+)